MGSIFAPADIEALVASFPPLSISGNGRPPVVRTSSKNGLRKSSDALSSFESLVENNHQPISKSNLTSVLGIEQGSEGLLLDQLDSQLYYSSDNTHIIPHPLINNIATELKGRATKQAVDLHAFARERDIAFQSLNKLIEEYMGPDWPRSIIDINSTSLLCTHAYSEELKVQISDATSSTGSDICNLSKAVGEIVPSELLVALATEVVAINGGSVSSSGDHVIYTPPGFDDAAAQQAEKLRIQRVAEFVDQLKMQGYCVVEESQSCSAAGSNEGSKLSYLVLEAFAKAQPHSMRATSLDIVNNGEKTRNRISLERLAKLLVTAETLQNELEHVRNAVKKRAAATFRTDPSTAIPSNIVRNVQPSDYEEPYHEDLAELLLRTERMKELEATASTYLSELESARNSEFVDLIETRLWCPLHCYAAGILEIQDPTLKQHLEDFLVAHFKSEVVPNALSAAKEQKFLHDRQHKKETEKLQKAVEEARTWDDVQKSVAKFSKKLSISPPSEDLVLRTKSRILDLTVKAMQRMTRGSDILQNLIWVLLATSGPGLFMSPGKDTSRMIKQCDEVVRLEAPDTLVTWRDKLKSGLQDEEDLRQMKELARSAVEAWKNS